MWAVFLASMVALHKRQQTVVEAGHCPRCGVAVSDDKVNTLCIVIHNLVIGACANSRKGLGTRLSSIPTSCTLAGKSLQFWLPRSLASAGGEVD